MGVAFLPEWTVGDDLAAGRLAAVLPAYTLPPLTLYAVNTSREYMTPKRRTFIGFFSAALGGGGSAAQSASVAIDEHQPGGSRGLV